MKSSWRKSSGELGVRNRWSFHVRVPTISHTPTPFLPHLLSYKQVYMPCGHLYVQLVFSISAGGPTMFENCHLQMMMSYVDIQTAIQQKGLPLGSMCKQFPQTPTEAQIWQSSSISEQCRYSIWIILDTKVNTFWGS